MNDYEGDGLRDILRDGIAAMREVSNHLGKSSANDATLAHALRDSQRALKELADIRHAANAAALAEARRQGREEALAEIRRAADQESSQGHRALVAAVSAPMAEAARSAVGKRLLNAAFLGAVALVIAACAWGSYHLGIGGVPGGQ